MPLLGGRHKSTSATGAAGPPAVAGRSQDQRPEAEPESERPVCESPLFGTRKQLPVGGAPPGQEPAPEGSRQLSAAMGSVPRQMSRQQLRFGFSIIDTNRDGMIDLRDLSRTLANLGVPIDEAILAYLMSRVSKRADRRISEDEFLSWFSDVVQVSDAHSPSELAAAASSRAGRRAPEAGAGLCRSSSSSLMAAPLGSDAAGPQRNRRGSGSGLALMRSLSNTSVRPAPAAAEAPRAEHWLASAAQEARRQADLEARRDLRAAFCVFDLDGDGFISLDEVSAGLRLLGETWSQTEVRHLFASCPSRAAKSGAGQRISIDDFIGLLL